jgi:hypothetical protein
VAEAVRLFPLGGEAHLHALVGAAHVERHPRYRDLLADRD